MFCAESSRTRECREMTGLERRRILHELQTLRRQSSEGRLGQRRRKGPVSTPGRYGGIKVPGLYNAPCGICLYPRDQSQPSNNHQFGRHFEGCGTKVLVSFLQLVLHIASTQARDLD